MTPDEIKTTLDLHAKWLLSENGGKRANLEDANLRGANLSHALILLSQVEWMKQLVSSPGGWICF